jgi:endonuclease YncB( thermonuclease family)
MQQLTDFWKTTSGKLTILGGGGIVALLSFCFICTVCSALFGGDNDSRLAARETQPPIVSVATQAPIPEPTATTLSSTPTPLPPPAESERPTPTATQVVPDTPTLTPVLPTDTPAPEPTPTETAQAAAPAEVELQEAFVIYVVDGDTIDVVIDNVEYRVRYLLIDTPETKHPDKGVEPFGPEASQANQELVLGKNVLLEKDVSETDQYGRLLRYVYVDGLLVNEELLRRGLARVTTFPPDVKYVDRFLAVEQEAHEAGRGLWGQALAVAPTPLSGSSGGSGQVVVDPACCRFDAPGNDNDNKEEEFVCLGNSSGAAVELTGWMVKDEHGWTYTFPTFTLEPGAKVQVRTGCGSNTSQELFWCKDGTAVWNNGGDTVFLFDPVGNQVAEYSY